MRKILALLLLLGLVALIQAPAAAQTPPCSNRWFEVRPTSMIP